MRFKEAMSMQTEPRLGTRDAL